MNIRTLQNNFNELQDAYNMVVDLYNNDDIDQDDDVEELLNEAKDLIEEIGEIDENDFADEDEMEELNDTMVTILDALSGIVDSMSGDEEDDEDEEEYDEEDEEEDEEDDEDDPDLTYVDGLYANDGNGRDFVILFYSSDEGDYAYVHDGNEEAIAPYEVEEAELDDGTEYEVINVGGLSIGYIDDDEDVFIVDMDDGTIYAASHLSEDEAEGFYSILNDD